MIEVAISPTLIFSTLISANIFSLLRAERQLVKTLSKVRLLTEKDNTAAKFYLQFVSDLSGTVGLIIALNIPLYMVMTPPSHASFILLLAVFFY